MLQKNKKIKSITIVVSDFNGGNEEKINIDAESGVLLWGGDKVTVDMLNSFYWDKRERVTVKPEALVKNLGDLVSHIEEFKGNPVEINEENIVRYWATAVNYPLLCIDKKGVPSYPGKK